MFKKAARIFLYVLIFLVLIIGAFFIFIRQPAFQTYLAHQATNILSRSLHTKISIERVEISFFNKADLVNFYMEDRRHDTLICAKDCNVRFKVFELLGKKIEVSSIVLDDAVVNMHRDSAEEEFNLINIFSPSVKPNASPVAVDKKPGGFSWDINLDYLKLNNTAFRYFDEKGRLDMHVKLASAEVDLDKLDLKNKLIAIQSIKIDKANVFVDELLKVNRVSHQTDEDFHLLKGDLKITLQNLSLSGSTVGITNHNNDTLYPNRMDFNHLLFSDINLQLGKSKIEKDTVIADLKQLAFKEKCGFILENFATQLRFSTQEITLAKLDLKTPNSELKKYISLHYNSTKDFKDFFNAVRLKASLDDSRFSFTDLNYFVSGLKDMAGTRIVLEGDLDGRLNNLRGRGIKITTGKRTVFEGNFFARGLPVISETSLNLRVSRLATSIEDVKHFYPKAIIPDNLYSLGNVEYSGSLDGFINDFVSKGKLITSIGSAITDVNFKYDKHTNKASYAGSVSLDEFDLGKYFNASEIVGKVSMDTKVNGTGLTLESLDAKLDGSILNITVKNYNYKDITLSGSVLKKSFNGIVHVRDRFLDFDFDGKADLTNLNRPEFKFQADIRKAQFKNLNLLADDIRFSGNIKSNFRGSKIDDLQGSLELDNATISRDSLSEKVKQFALTASTAGTDKKLITLVSDFAEAEMEGNFTFKNLPRSLLSFSKYTFTKDYVDTLFGQTKEDFTLDLRIFQPGNLPSIIYPKLKTIHNTHITCDFNSTERKLKINADVPEIAYGNFNARWMDLIVNSSKGEFSFYADAARVYSGDSVMLDSASITAATSGNDISVDIKGFDQTHQNYADVSANITPSKNKTIVSLLPGDIKLGSNYWHFEPNDSIVIEGKKITTRNLVFRTEEQKVSITSYLKNDTSTSLKITLDNTGLSDFAKTFTAKVKDLSGTMNGKVVIEDIFYKPEILADFVVSDFKLGNELIGDINIDTRLDSSRNKVMLYASVKGLNNDLEARGFVSIDPEHPDLEIDLDAPKLGLNFLNYKFFDKYVKNVRGYAITKNIRIYGTLKKPLLAGDILLVNDTVTVSFTNTTYHLINQHAALDEHGFDLNGITIHDVNNKVGHGSGRINHEGFKDFYLDLKVTTGDMQFLNTTAKESPNFYGIGYGSGWITFIGPVNSPFITASATSTKGTYCKLPINSTYETNRYGNYKFVQHGDTSSAKTATPLKLNGITFKLDLTVTPAARMDIILDPIAGDVLSSYGSGNLQIEIPKNGTTTMIGHYDVERGNYLFTLQSIVHKPFDISEGGSIDFVGDINKARVNIDAVYKVRTSVTDLISDLIGTSSNQLVLAAQATTQIDLIMNLTGNLEKPSIAWDIRALNPDPVVKSYVEQKLGILKVNETEMYKQVFGLLVMQSFIPSAQSTSTFAATNSGTAATNTVSEFLSSQFSSYISNLLEFANIRNLDVNLGLKQYDQTIAGSTTGTNNSVADTRTEARLALSQRLFNNRLTINAGGNLDFGTGAYIDPNTGQLVTTARSVIPTGDFQVEYSLTADGNWRAKVFNTTNYDFINERNNNQTGLGISYRHEFENAAELFSKRDAGKPKKIKKAKEPEAPKPARDSIPN